MFYALYRKPSIFGIDSSEAIKCGQVFDVLEIGFVASDVR